MKVVLIFSPAHDKPQERTELLCELDDPSLPMIVSSFIFEITEYLQKNKDGEVKLITVP